jgi:glycosyltransferase involved in cell wall biosynthesis
MKSLAEYLRIPSSMITFTGMLEGEALAGMVQKADFSVVSSRYETFGTVIIESLYCGTPVLSTNVGIAPEILNSSNGIVVEPDNEQALTQGLKKMIAHCLDFDKMAISRQITGQFGSDVIGHQLWKIYREILDHRV